MKHKKRICLLTASVLTLALVIPAAAAPTDLYIDLPNSHWAYDAMHQCVEYGIVSGIGDRQMGPSLPLSWAQYLTMLSRTFAGEKYAKALDSGLSWQQAGYKTAMEIGLLKKRDFLPIQPDLLDAPLTRKDVAVLLDRAMPDEIEEPFRWWMENDPVQLVDLDEMDRDYQQSVQRLLDLEIIQGRPDQTFGGSDTIQRADGCVLLLKTLELVDRFYMREEKEITLFLVDSEGTQIVPELEIDSYVGEYLSDLAYYCAPDDYICRNPKDSRRVSIACDYYMVEVRPLTQAEREEREASRQLYEGEITYEEYIMKDFWLYYPDENPRKYLRLFGEEDRYRFTNQHEAENVMTVVTVPVWRFFNGVKKESTASFSVHQALAEDVVKIFTEIFEDPEQFPINAVGGYSWRGDNATGEHNSGSAIDINPSENYQIRNGRVETGILWEPGINQYSIPEDGSVVRIFEKYGWSWGGNAWAEDADPYEGYHDYMHFSYLGN